MATETKTFAASFNSDTREVYCAQKETKMNKKRDITDKDLRRAAAKLGYKGKNLPLAIADAVEHPNRKGFTWLQVDGETRREAVARLERWPQTPPAVVYFLAIKGLA